MRKLSLAELIAESSFLADVDNAISEGEAVTTHFDLNARANIGGIEGLITLSYA